MSLAPPHCTCEVGIAGRACPIHGYVPMSEPRPTPAPDIHVMPVGDLRAHRETRTCWCRPRVEKQPDWRAALVTHNSMDGRELIEQTGLH